MQLPTLIDPVTARAVLADETRVLDMAASLLEMHAPSPEGEPDGPHQLISDHLSAIALADELCMAHSASHPLDEPLHRCARQLKLWHLFRLSLLANP